MASITWRFVIDSFCQEHDHCDCDHGESMIMVIAHSRSNETNTAPFRSSNGEHMQEKRLLFHKLHACSRLTDISIRMRQISHKLMRTNIYHAPNLLRRWYYSGWSVLPRIPDVLQSARTALICRQKVCDQRFSWPGNIKYTRTMKTPDWFLSFTDLIRNSWSERITPFRWEKCLKSPLGKSF